MPSSTSWLPSLGPRPIHSRWHIWLAGGRTPGFIRQHSTIQPPPSLSMKFLVGRLGLAGGCRSANQPPSSVARSLLRIRKKSGRRAPMCDRSAPLPLASLRAMDFDRRSFLRTAGAGALVVAVGSGLHGHAHAAESHIKSVHGSGFCNLNYFLTEAKQLAKDDGVILDFVVTPTSAEMVTFLGAGQVDAA